MKILRHIKFIMFFLLIFSGISCDDDMDDYQVKTYDLINQDKQLGNDTINTILQVIRGQIDADQAQMALTGYAASLRDLDAKWNNITPPEKWAKVHYHMQQSIRSNISGAEIAMEGCKLSDGIVIRRALNALNDAASLRHQAVAGLGYAQDWRH